MPNRLVMKDQQTGRNQEWVNKKQNKEMPPIQEIQETQVFKPVKDRVFKFLQDQQKLVKDQVFKRHHGPLKELLLPGMLKDKVRHVAMTDPQLQTEVRKTENQEGKKVNID